MGVAAMHQHHPRLAGLPPGFKVDVGAFNDNVAGAGRYTDDIGAHGQTYAVFARSPHARAKLNGLDASAALATEGVVAVFTGYFKDDESSEVALQPKLLEVLRVAP